MGGGQHHYYDAAGEAAAPFELDVVEAVENGSFTMSNIVRLKSADSEALRRAQQKQQEEQSYLEAADQWLNEQPMHYAATQGRYLLRVGSAWKFIKPEAMKPYCPVWDTRFANAIREKQSERGWLHLDVTYTFRNDLPPNVLNLMDRSGWVKPEEGEH